MLNNIVIKGNLTKDCELKTVGNGTELATFSIAVNDKYKDNEKTYFFDCKFFGKSGAAFAQYHGKGSQCLLVGSIEQERWEKDDQKRSKVVINVRSFEFVGGKQEGQQSGGHSDARAPQRPSAPANEPDFDDSESPF